MNWLPTKKINDFTNQPNQQIWIEGFQGLVFRRRFGWSYTVRFMLLDGTWLQKSAGSQDYWAGIEHAQRACIESIYQLQKMLNTVVKIPALVDE